MKSEGAFFAASHTTMDGSRQGSVTVTGAERGDGSPSAMRVTRVSSGLDGTMSRTVEFRGAKTEAALSVELNADAVPRPPAATNPADDETASKTPSCRSEVLAESRRCAILAPVLPRPGVSAV